MAIVELRWLRDQRSVSFSDGVFTVQEMVQVETDLALAPGATVTSDPLFFIGDPEFPAIGSEHPENSGLRFHNIGRGTQTKERKDTWTFPLIYTSNQPTVAEQSGNANYQPDEYVDSLIASKEWSFRAVTIPRRPSKVSDDDGSNFTTNAYPITTTAGEPILAEESIYLPTVTYTRNELSVPASILSIVGSVNSDSITVDGITVSARKCLIADAKISPWKRDRSYQFRTVTYTLMLNPETWDLKVLNRGFYEKLPNQQETRALVYDGKLADDTTVKKPRFATSPVLLKFTSGGTADEFYDEGTTLQIGKTAIETWGGTDTPKDIHFRRFQHPQLAAFSALAIS